VQNFIVAEVRVPLTKPGMIPSGPLTHRKMDVIAATDHGDRLFRGINLDLQQRANSRL
jgi:hypothetical protein